MRFLNPKSVRFKIVLYTTLCLAAVGLVSNLYLYTYMNRIIARKAESIDTLYFDTIEMQLDTQLRQMRDLAVLCKSSPDVTRLLNNTSLHSLTAKKEALQAQTVLNDYLHSFNLDGYVNKLMAFNTSGVVVQAVAQHDGALSDYTTLVNGGNFEALQSAPRPPFSLLLPSITPFKGSCLAGLFSVNAPFGRGGKSYIYIELKPEIILDTLEPYATLNPIFASTANGEKLLSQSWAGAPLSSLELGNLTEGQLVQENGRSYKINTRSLTAADIQLYNCTDLSTITLDSQKMAYTMLVVVLSVMLVSVSTLIIMSNFITQPINKLIARIRRISANDFSYDPEIERSGDEIGEIGKVVNEMMMSINTLLKENDQQNEQRRNIEIALLQSQVNPHFLYNTLDSIHWMAVIQKSPGICNMTQSLSNLLKNLAKGTQDKITLKEELALLQDYISIQSIRYLETFEVVTEIPEALLSCRIIKFTLQPLVENAIFHGIAPTGVCGVITLRAYEEEDCLCITVHDNGMGIDAQTLSTLLSPRRRAPGKSSFNGIGVNNVDQRLKLVYGKPYGLFYESEPGRFTCVTVKIPKEVSDV